MTGSRWPERDMDIYRRRMRGEKNAALAAEYGLAENSISAIVTKVSRSMPEQDRSEILALAAEHLDDIRSKVLSLWSLQSAPVTVGQHGDILREPSEDGNGEIVRDHSLKVRAAELLLKIEQTVGKRYGLDAPTQAEVKASVQYEIVGVDPEALT